MVRPRTGVDRLRVQARDLAGNLVALEDAYGLHIIAVNPSLSPSIAEPLIVEAASCGTDCPELVTRYRDALATTSQST